MRNPPPLSHNSPNSGWADSLTNNEAGIKENHAHFWGKDPSKALSANSPYEDFTTGSGLDIYKSTILPALETAEHEIILVTCFWAPSETLNLLSATLIRLSDRFLARSHSRSHDAPPKLLRVRLCFSSRSFFQKLLHTSSLAGHVYPPSQWVSKLGLPPPEKLRGLDLQVKSVFQLPFSVMHPKFVIIDRRRVFFPSCNVSYETWLECCISFQGPIVVPLLQFWNSFWGDGGCDDLLPNSPLSLHQQQEGQTQNGQQYSSSPPSRRVTTSAILLPSPHHRFALPSPSIPFLSSRPAIPPPTPLNTFILHLLRSATHSITLLTPNLTSPPLLPAILSALNRNINITIITNRRMMLPEQLLTAGTITEIFIWRLLRKYRKAVSTTASTSAATLDEEEATTGILGSRRPNQGRLRIGYFMSDDGGAKKGGGLRKSHVKCTVVDDAVLVLGSGNMDRASWFTSQELGVAVAVAVAVGELGNGERVEGGCVVEAGGGDRREREEVGGKGREEVGKFSGEAREEVHVGGGARDEVVVVKEVWERLEERLEGRVEKYFGW